jgi:thiamine biosynthesis lipoprotein
MGPAAALRRRWSGTLVVHHFTVGAEKGLSHESSRSSWPGFRSATSLPDHSLARGRVGGGRRSPLGGRGPGPAGQLQSGRHAELRHSQRRAIPHDDRPGPQPFGQQRPAAPAGPTPGSDPAPQRHSLRRLVSTDVFSETFSALGTTATLVVTEPTALPRSRRILDEVLADIDRSCSRFRADSDLSRVNDAGGQPVTVSPTLIDAVDVALRAARLTDGDVDPTIGKALRLLGYDRDFATVAATGGPLSYVAERVPGWWTVDVDHTAGTVRVPDGVQLDLGATAKALAADRAAAAIAQDPGGGVLVSLGGDVAVAGPAPNAGWAVLVTDDHAAGPDAPGETVAIRTGGMATSSTAVRRWRRGDDAVHHIVDPATSRAADAVWRTVTVVAASCVDANIATTSAMVRGETAIDWLTGLTLAARLVRPDGTVVRIGDWPEPTP